MASEVVASDPRSPGRNQVTSGAPGLYGSSTDDSTLQPMEQPVLLERLSTASKRRQSFPQGHRPPKRPASNVNMKMRFRDWLGRYPMHCQT